MQYDCDCGIFNDFGPLVSWTSGLTHPETNSLVQKVGGGSATEHKRHELLSLYM